MHNIIDYMTEPRFKQMMVDLSKANTDDEINDIIRQHNQVELSEEEKQRYSDTVISDFDTILKKIDEDIEELKADRIREKIGELDKAISFAYIAKHYFGKSQSWLTQRLNGSRVNGKEARFNKSEVMQLEEAIHDLGRKLSSLTLL
jgi:predicted transcriptional regulator